MALLALLLLWAGTRVELVDEVYTIPPAKWRFVPVDLKQMPVAVHCNFQSVTNDTELRVALLSRADLELLNADQPHGFLAATQLGMKGTLTYQLHRAGEYAVVIDNRGLRAPARVQLRVWLDFSTRAAPGVGYLAPERKLAVILISFAVFFAIVTWSARKLLQATRR
jgi:hypothetical protein